jgi:hypothetical protein
MAAAEKFPKPFASRDELVKGETGRFLLPIRWNVGDFLNSSLTLLNYHLKKLKLRTNP